MHDGVEAPNDAGSLASERGRTQRALIVAAGLSLAAAVLVSDVALCPFAQATGHPCPGCGMTRACLALLTGDFALALHMHPLSFVGLPLVSLLAAEGVFAYVTGRKPSWSERAFSALRVNVHWVFGILVGLLLAIWIARFFGALGGPAPVNG